MSEIRDLLKRAHDYADAGTGTWNRRETGNYVIVRGLVAEVERLRAGIEHLAEVLAEHQAHYYADIPAADVESDLWRLLDPPSGALSANLLPTSVEVGETDPEEP